MGAYGHMGIWAYTRTYEDGHVNMPMPMTVERVFAAAVSQDRAAAAPTAAATAGATAAAAAALILDRRTGYRVQGTGSYWRLAPW